MPDMRHGRLTDEDAQELEAFFDSNPRAVYPFRQQDWQAEELRVDSVYRSSR